MKNRYLKNIPIILLLLLSAEQIHAQCANNMGFESGNFSSWNTATDSLFIQPANRVNLNPGRNMAVVNYGVTDAWLGTITRANTTVGNRLVKIGNRGVRAVADTVYRSYIVDSLSDKLTIYSIGVSELAHNYWNVPINEAPGFGYEIYINGRKIDCLRGSFFCGNLDMPRVWQLGTFTDTATVRKSTGWGEETLNLACFVGDTVEVRLFTRDCILLGHYAYAYFDVVCGDTSKPVLSQIQINDMIASDELNLYCTPGATLFIEPQTEICPIFMGNLVWTPANHIVGPQTLDSAIISVADSAWIYVEAEFSNFCMTVNIIDSVFVRKLNADPLDNIPKVNRNFCDCMPDTLDFSTVDINTIWDSIPSTYSLDANGLLIFNPCDKFYQTVSWKDANSRATVNGSAVGSTNWTSGNNAGAIGYDTLMPGSTARFIITPTAGKTFYVGLNANNTSANNDLDHSIYVNGTNIRAYYGNSDVNNLGTFTGTITVDFVIASNRRVRVYINGVLEHTYSSGQLSNSNVFPDYSGRSAHNPHINAAYTLGPTRNVKSFDRVVNPAPYRLFMDFVDRCGIQRLDTMSFTPGFTANILNDIVQCGLDPANINVQSSSLIDRLDWTSNAWGTFNAPFNGTPRNNQPLNYTPVATDYNFNAMQVIVTATSGRCTDTDTAEITINENPSADAGADITTSLDSFTIGGNPSGSCATCPSFNIDWSQGNALSDSTIDNPYVYRDLIGAPFFVVRITDPSTGCFSFDTVEVFTSLSNKNSSLDRLCLSDKQVELNWIMLPDQDVSQFAVDYSIDGGRTWINTRTLNASQQFAQNSVSYKMSIDKQQNQSAIYRWYTISPSGEKHNMMMLDDLSCQNGNVYTIFPNPFTEKLEIQIESNNGAKSNYTIQILNQYGQVVYEELVSFTEASTYSNFTVDGLGNLSTGIYYVNIKNNDVMLYKTVIVKAE